MNAFKQLQVSIQQLNLRDFAKRHQFRDGMIGNRFFFFFQFFQNTQTKRKHKNKAYRANRVFLGVGISITCYKSIPRIFDPSFATPSEVDRDSG